MVTPGLLGHVLTCIMGVAVSHFFLGRCLSGLFILDRPLLELSASPVLSLKPVRGPDLHPVPAGAASGPPLLCCVVTPSGPCSGPASPQLLSQKLGGCQGPPTAAESPGCCPTAGCRCWGTWGSFLYWTAFNTCPKTQLWVRSVAPPS